MIKVICRNPYWDKTYIAKGCDIDYFKISLKNIENGNEDFIVFETEAGECKSLSPKNLANIEFIEIEGNNND